MTNVTSKAGWYRSQIARHERDIEFAKTNGHSDRIPWLQREITITKILLDSENFAKLDAGVAWAEQQIAKLQGTFRSSMGERRYSEALRKHQQAPVLPLQVLASVFRSESSARLQLKRARSP